MIKQNKKLLLSAAIAGILAAGSSLSSWAAQTVLEEGTVLPVTLDAGLSSSNSKKGDKFTVTVESDRAEAYGLPAGTRVHGVIRAAQKMENKKPGMLDLDFRTLELPGGTQASIVGSVINLDDPDVKTAEDGRLVAKNTEGKKVNRTQYVLYGAGAGLIFGLLKDGKIGSSIEEIIIGAGLGYLAGATTPSGSEPRDVNLKEGDRFGVYIGERVALNVPGGSAGTQAEGSRPLIYPEDSASPSETGSTTINTGQTATSRGDVAVVVDARELQYDTLRRPQIVGGVLMVPAATTLRQAGVEFQFANNNRTLMVEGPNGPFTVTLGSRVAMFGMGERLVMDAPAQRMNDTMYIPLRMVATMADKKLVWDAPTRTAILEPHTAPNEML